jgi:hypothetical protein
MTFIPASGCVRISLQFSYSGQTVVNTISLKKSTTVDESDLPLLCSAAQGWWETYLKPSCHADFRLETISAIDLTSDSGPSYTQTLSPTIAGTSTGDKLPANAAAVISWRTAFRGRSYRGRMYVSGFTDAALYSATRITAAFQAVLVVAAANLSTFFSPYDYSHVVISRYTDGAPRTSGFAALVLSAVVDVFVDSMRRRLEGRGS